MKTSLVMAAIAALTLLVHTMDAPAQYGYVKCQYLDGTIIVIHGNRCPRGTMRRF